MSTSRRGEHGARLLILTRRPDVPTTRRLIEAAPGAGLAATALDDRVCRLVVRGGPAEVWIGDRRLAAPDVVLPRAAPRQPSSALSVLRAFGDSGAYVANRPGPVARARDKLRALQALSLAGVPVPETVWPCRADDVAALVASLGGPPVVIKNVRGMQGMGVCRADSVASARSVIEAFFAARVPVIVQRWVGEAAGVDHRLLVVGDEVVAAMERRAVEGDFRANVHRGGTCAAHVPSDREAALARQAVRALGLDLAGVDLLPTRDGPVVLEVNASPGLTGIEAATGIDVASAICRYLAGKAVERPARRAGTVRA